MKFKLNALAFFQAKDIDDAFAKLAEHFGSLAKGGEGIEFLPESSLTIEPDVVKNGSVVFAQDVVKMPEEAKHRGDIAWCECDCHLVGSPQPLCESCYEPVDIETLEDTKEEALRSFQPKIDHIAWLKNRKKEKQNG